MKTKKLIPLLDYVLEKTNYHFNKCYVDQDSANTDLIDRIHNYAKFLSQPLKLSMFIICDENGNVLEKPLCPTNENGCNGLYCKIAHKNYNKAKSNVLFEGFEIETDMHHQTKREIIWMPNKIDQVWRRLTYHTGEIEIFFFTYYEDFGNVESIIKHGLTLTENAVKTING